MPHARLRESYTSDDVRGAGLPSREMSDCKLAGLGVVAGPGPGQLAYTSAYGGRGWGAQGLCTLHTDVLSGRASLDEQAVQGELPALLTARMTGSARVGLDGTLARRFRLVVRGHSAVIGAASTP